VDKNLEIASSNQQSTQRIFYEIGHLSRQELVRRYSTLAWGYINQSETQAIEGVIARCAKKSKLDSILDVGCGTGRLLIPLSQKYRVTGLDFSKSFINQLEQSHPEIPVKFGNATDLPFQEKSFSSILCVRLIQHLTSSEQVKFLNESHRILKDRGFLILMNYNALNWLTLYKKQCQNGLGKIWPRWPFRKWNWQIDDYHFAWELKSLCQKHGFKVIEQISCTPGEPDLDRFLKIDAWLGRYVPSLQEAYYSLLMFFNVWGRVFPFSWFFSRIIVVCEKR